MQIVASGRSAHAASNHLGDNAIYKVLPITDAISRLEPQLGDDALGHGKITVTDMKVETPSINAVPNLCTVYIDRRPHLRRERRRRCNRIRDLVPAEHVASGDVRVEMLRYDEPSYTGFVFPVDKYFPAWAIDAGHPLVQAGLETARRIGLLRTRSRQMELQHQRHLLGGQSRHPLHRLRPWRGRDRPHRQRQRPPGRRGEGDRVLRAPARADRKLMACSATPGARKDASTEPWRNT